MEISTPYADFSQAAKAVLEYLHARLGLSLWMVTRTEGEDWIVLESQDYGYGVTKGDVFRWADSFCSQMVQGNGPSCAADSNQVPAYVAAPIGKQVPISAYVGVPIHDSDGGLFGTLCAIDPKPQCESIEMEMPLVYLMGRLLGTILVSEMKLSAEGREVEKTELSDLIDPYTGLFNTEAWNRIIASEEMRCSKFGHPAQIISIQLSSIEQIKSASNSIQHELPPHAISAHLGNGQICVLVPEQPAIAAQALTNKLNTTLESNQIEAEIQSSTRDPRSNLNAAVELVLS